MRLGQRQSDGCTLREHLQAGSDATGRADPLLSFELPACVSAIWQAFCDLVRPVGMSAGAIPSVEIDAWQRLARVVLTPWEVDTLRAMDRAALAVLNEKPAAP